MNIPLNLKYTEDHEWLLQNEDGTAYIGITDFAQSELGDLVYVDIDTVGDSLKKGDVFGTVEAVKTTSDLFLPVSGIIMELNKKLDSNAGDDPAIINKDPYGDGWIVKIELNDPAEVNDLLDADAYKKLIGK
ncbi:MAG: glycine cleavage system protein GcvH [Saprospiraceae bacterium]|nr:glycine cleavage system protein GcvH [Saprospiraceae bacterium]